MSMKMRGELCLIKYDMLLLDVTMNRYFIHLYEDQ